MDWSYNYIKKKKGFPVCVSCPYEVMERICKKPGGKHPKNCPTVSDYETVKESLEEFEDKKLKEFARIASIQEAEGYANRELGYEQVKPVKPRIVEIIEFAQKLNYTRLGLAYCTGLSREAEKVHQLLTSRGFEVVSVVCKVGGIPKEKIGLKDDEKIEVGSFESMCNPISQAKIFNKHQTDFNILLGLCVGHDSLFFKYSKAPCTVLAVKDRVLGHNPPAAIYNLDSYYRSLK